MGGLHFKIFRDHEKAGAFYDRSRSAHASSVSIYEVFKQTLANEDRSVAALRAGTIEREYDVIDVDSEIARDRAEISHRLRIPMAWGLINRPWILTGWVKWSSSLRTEQRRYRCVHPDQTHHPECLLNPRRRRNEPP